MKKVDAICAKLKGQANVKEEDSGCSVEPTAVNKRKNFQPVPVKFKPDDATSLTDGKLIIDDKDEDSNSLQEFPLNVPVPFVGPNFQSNFPENVNFSSNTIISSANPSLEHYIIRFDGSNCAIDGCRMAVNNREHFHCRQCDYRVFTKKEEMLRHYKWHRKREESLAHGFMRYSASDKCRSVFRNCCHELKQTHYHCLHPGCGKVYVSTSDVQMHANSHRKAAHIAREGFQRYKASEDCQYAECPFRDPKLRTTHFHCLRPGCSHSFKNKSDMDKHKTHHLREVQLVRDGFKKFMKTEPCMFAGCPYTKHTNHIHCIRPGFSLTAPIDCHNFLT